jgi:hypothetical protein
LARWLFALRARAAARLNFLKRIMVVTICLSGI